MLKASTVIVFYMFCCNLYAGLEDWKSIVEKTSEMKGLVVSLVAVDKDSESIMSLKELYADKLCNPATYSFVDTCSYGNAVPTDAQISAMNLLSTALREVILAAYLKSSLMQPARL